MKKKIVWKKEFHNSQSVVVCEVNDYGCFRLSVGQQKKIEKETCGMDDCHCPAAVPYIDGKKFEIEFFGLTDEKEAEFNLVIWNKNGEQTSPKRRNKNERNFER